ncbi:hypothetical protein EJ06DRAFT_376333 [Trichodelitschia bisporula]|uniref:Uncharacterized protein n=1 Tax=Trichodelitschia bisporula TaxID=703511 RepID=A0A6G1HYI8_9PEZI|nr:hypothetical protein EJ06DRAFT_376333 [Trichodelitschia bisporula]
MFVPKERVGGRIPVTRQGCAHEVDAKYISRMPFCLCVHLFISRSSGAGIPTSSSYSARHPSPCLNWGRRFQTSNSIRSPLHDRPPPLSPCSPSRSSHYCRAASKRPWKRRKWIRTPAPRARTARPFTWRGGKRITDQCRPLTRMLKSSWQERGYFAPACDGLED